MPGDRVLQRAPFFLLSSGKGRKKKKKHHRLMSQHTRRSHVCFLRAPACPGSASPSPGGRAPPLPVTAGACHLRGRMSLSWASTNSGHSRIRSSERSPAGLPQKTQPSLPPALRPCHSSSLSTPSPHLSGWGLSQVGGHHSGPPPAGTVTLPTPGTPFFPPRLGAVGGSGLCPHPWGWGPSPATGVRPGGLALRAAFLHPEGLSAARDPGEGKFPPPSQLFSAHQ